MKAIEQAGYKPGKDVYLGLDCASTEFFKDGKYVYEGEGKTRSIKQQAKYLAKLAKGYPIVSIEDGMAEDDWEGWRILTDLIGNNVPTRRRRSLRHQYQAAEARASRRGSPIRSWSRSTRSVR